MKMNFSFKVIFFIPGSDLSNSFEAFLVLCFISLLFLYEKYRVAQALQVPRLADPKFSNTDLSLTQPWNTLTKENLYCGSSQREIPDYEETKVLTFEQNILIEVWWKNNWGVIDDNPYL